MLGALTVTCDKSSPQEPLAACSPYQVGKAGLEEVRIRALRHPQPCEGLDYQIRGPVVLGRDCITALSAGLVLKHHSSYASPRALGGNGHPRTDLQGFDASGVCLVFSAVWRDDG